MRKQISTIVQIFFNLLRTPMLVVNQSSIPLSSRVAIGAKIVRSSIGRYCYIGPHSIINKAVIGNYCSIAPGVQIGGMEHSWWWASTSTHLSSFCRSDDTTIIEHDVWIGANAVVRKGVRIGCGAVIGAAAVVTKDIPRYAIVVGIPAKLMRMRFCEKTIESLHLSEYWKYRPRKAKDILQSICKSERWA